MASNRAFRVGPVAMSATLTTDIFSPAAAGSGTGYTPSASYAIIKHIRIVNKTAGAVTFSLWLGASGGNAAGTEVVGIGVSIPANDYFDWYGQMRINSGEYLVGGASAGTSLSITLEGEVGLA